MTSFTGREREEHDRLDADLDALTGRGSVRGAPLSDFGPTIDHLYRLASDAGVLTNADRNTPATRTDITRRLVSSHPSADRSRRPRSSQWRSAMSFASMAAVALIVLTVTFGQYGYAPGGNSDEATRLAAQTGATPTADIAIAPDHALISEDCAVTAQTREELIALFGNVPDIGGPTSSPAPIQADQALYDTFQATFLEWQACDAYGLTWQRTALQSEQSLRFEMYGGFGAIPYSEVTLNEILDNWEAIDVYETEQVFSNTNYPIDLAFYVINPAGLVVVPETEVRARLLEYSVDGSLSDSGGTVIFIYEDDAWAIDQITLSNRG